MYALHSHQGIEATGSFRHCWGCLLLLATLAGLDPSAHSLMAAGWRIAKLPA